MSVATKKAINNSDAWIITTLEKITDRIEKTRPQDKPEAEFKYLDIGGIDNKLLQVVDYKTYLGKDAPSRAQQLIKADDIAFANVRPYLKNLAMVTTSLDGQVGSTGFCFLRAKNGIEPKYIFYWVQSDTFIKEISKHQRGSSYPAVTNKQVLEQSIPLAPPEQQKQIVAKIEELFSHIDAGIAALKQSKQLLKQYRQSVLKAAVTGELSKEWREQNKDKLEPASKLLERILQERRQKWEAQQLEQFKAKGKMPKDEGWKDKYKEPSAPDTSDLPELPEGWCWVSLDNILFDIKTGKSFRCDERPPEEGEVGVVKVSAVSWGHYLEEESKTCIDKKLIRPEYFVKNGDFLFSRANTIELVGACVIVERTTKDIMLSDKILRFDLNEDVKKWILYLLRSKHGREEIESLATGNQDSMRNIGQERIKSIRVPITGSDEIQWISDAVESRLSSIDEIEKSLDSELKRSERLKQSVLQSAFGGGLV